MLPWMPAPNGYILKDASQNELILALEYVMDGKTFLSPSISDKVVDVYLEQKKNKHKLSAGQSYIAESRRY